MAKKAEQDSTVRIPLQPELGDVQELVRTSEGRALLFEAAIALADSGEYTDSDECPHARCESQGEWKLPPGVRGKYTSAGLVICSACGRSFTVLGFKFPQLVPE